MAVEAPHLTTFFHQQLTSNRDLIKTPANVNNITTCNTDVCFAIPMNTTVPDGFFPYDPISSLNKSESGLTCYVTSSPRKRPRDSPVGDSDADAFYAAAAQKPRISGGFGSLIDAEVISQIQQHQSDIDRFITQHTEKLRFEIEERRRRQSKMLTSAVQSAIAKKLKERDDEIQRLGKLNWVLQERVKSLYVENQLLRDLAQTNEAAANNLRTNLEHVLAQVGGGCDDRRASAAPTAEPIFDDAASSCGSCDGAGRDVGDEINSGENQHSGGEGQTKAAGRGRCRRCGEREASVLLLPCRHLCLCTACGSLLLRACPVCDTVMNASVHVNLS